MKLVVNGDDLGYTRGNTYGIFQAYAEGILRSATALTNSPYFEWAVKTAEEQYPGLGVGCHMTLTLGRPLTENKTLTDPETGEFYKGSGTVFTKNPDYDEVYAEWKAQIEHFVRVAGHLPTHLDSHHHAHEATPEALQTALRLAEEYGLELRGHGSYKFVQGFYRDTIKKDYLIHLLEEHAGEDIELMCHPGWIDMELYRRSSYAFERVKELDILCDPEVIRYIEEHNITLCHY
ncbi:MAG: carbohydrate deacetylase [Solobacterium sp.]|nr:carbohydrate deacetylase [Solobacterium sp.]